MSEFIKRYKLFTPENYEKEENYLREMSLEGWHMKHMNSLGCYTFEKGEPASYSYRLDFAKNFEKDYRIKMYEDCGWSHIFEFAPPLFGGVGNGGVRWQYFRIASQTGREEALFSDIESKLEMLKRVRKFYTAIGVVMICVNILNFANIFHLSSQHYAEDFFVVAFVFAALIFAVLLWVKILFGLNVKIKKLKDF